VPDQVFRYAERTGSRILMTCMLVVLGLSLVALGVLLACVTPLQMRERIFVGIPPGIAGAICIWCPLRQLDNYIRVNPQGIKARLYFQTVEFHWEEIVALVARSHYLPPFGSLGVVYSIYAQKSKLYFTHRLPGAKQLADIASCATGLQWQ
jgi:hypothetical protein